MVITSLFDLDRTVREATARLARAGAAGSRLEWDEPIANPLAPLRELLSRQTYVELADVPDPLLVPALRAHVARLTLARVLWDDEVRVARAWGEASVALDESVRLPKLPSGLVATVSGAAAGLVAPRTLLLAVLADSDDVRRGGARGRWSAQRQRLRDPVRFMAERRAAAAAQLGVGLDAIDLPCPAGGARRRGGGLLAGTQEAAERFAPWDRGFARAMAHEAVHGWPARLGPRWVLSVFAGTDLARGAPVVDVRLPAALGGASFARALALFGQAFAEATAQAGLPFALARPVVDLRPHRLGALFGLLVAEPVFARRALALGQGAARDHTRLFARAFIARLRLGAAAARSRSALPPPEPTSTTASARRPPAPGASHSLPSSPASSRASPKPPPPISPAPSSRPSIASA